MYGCCLPQMPILKRIAIWKHLFYPLNLNGALSNSLRFRCLRFRCPSLGRWLMPCIEKPPLAFIHTLNPVSDYFTLSHAFVVYYTLFFRIRGLSQQVLSDFINVSICHLMSIVKQVLSRTVIEGCFLLFFGCSVFKVRVYVDLMSIFNIFDVDGKKM